MQTKLQSKKTYIINAVIILIVTLLTVFYMTKSGIFKQLDNLSKISWSGIFSIILIIIASILFHSFVYYSSNKVSEANLSFSQSTNAYLMGQFGSSITPLKSGHFPFIFYYYAKKKVPFEKSLSIVCLNQIVFSITTIITYLVIMITCLIKHTIITISGTEINLWPAALAGFLFNLVALLLVILMVYCKPFHKLIVKFSSFVLFKLKKISSRQEYESDHTQKMEVYKKQIDYIFKHLYKFILPILSFFLYIIFYCSIPYIIYLNFTNSTFMLNDYLFFFSLNQAMTYITNIIPLPGGTGVAEFSFITIFGTVFADSMVGAAMIIWRILTYYSLIIIEFIIFLAIMTTSKSKKQNSKEPFDNSQISQSNRVQNS